MSAESPEVAPVPPPATVRQESSGLRWLWLAGLVIALDQLSKLLIVRHYQLYESTPILPVLEIVRLHNTGAAFSFLAGASGWQRYFFVGLAFVVSAAVIAWLARLKARSQALLAAALSLVVGGALGNVVDRLRWHYVIDFIHVHWQDRWSFPAFNVADSAITIGAVLLILDSLLEARRARPPRPTASPP